MDNVLWGCITLLSAVLTNTYPDQPPDELLELILHNSLFEVPSQTAKGNNTRPKCKHSKSRKSAFQLLLKLCRNDDFVNLAMQYLKKHV